MKFREFLGKLNKLGDTKITARVVSKLFGVTLSHAHQDLNRLYRMGFVSRKRDSKDGRRFIYWVNMKGKKYLDYLEDLKGYALDRVNLRELYSAIDKNRLPKITKEWWEQKDKGKILSRVGCPSLIPLTSFEMHLAEKEMDKARSMDKAKADSRESHSRLNNAMIKTATNTTKIVSEHIANLNERIRKLEEFLRSEGYDPEEV